MPVFQEQGREGYFPPQTLWLVSLVQSLLDVLIHLEAETLVFLQAGRWSVNRNYFSWQYGKWTKI